MWLVTTTFPSWHAQTVVLYWSFDGNVCATNTVANDLDSSTKYKGDRGMDSALWSGGIKEKSLHEREIIYGDDTTTSSRTPGGEIVGIRRGRISVQISQ